MSHRFVALDCCDYNKRLALSIVIVYMHSLSSTQEQSSYLEGYTNTSTHRGHILLSKD